MLQFVYAVCATQGARDYQEDFASAWPVLRSVGPAQDASERTLEHSGEHSGERSGQATGQVIGTRAATGGALVVVLADGMGGHAGGAVASRIVCEKFLGTLKELFVTFPPDDPSAGDGDGDGVDIVALLSEGLMEANAAVADRVEEDPMLTGMGSTMVGVSFSSRGVEWISVGDSPLLLYRNHEIAMLNADHSLAPELDRLAEAGHITHEQARHDPRRHMLRSAVTGDELDLVDTSKTPLELEAGDYVVLASDGLETLEASEVVRIISAYGDDGAEAVAQALIRAVDAVRDPHQDNATVVVVRALEVDTSQESDAAADSSSGSKSGTETGAAPEAQEAVREEPSTLEP